MSNKIIAFILSFLSFFAVWNLEAQPNRIPETRSYCGEAPDKYGVWPTKEFTQGRVCPLVPGIMETYYGLGDLFSGTATESLSILYKGKLVYERYAEGWDKDTPHFMASVTKSFVSALVGIAIGEGKIKGVDQKVADFFPEAKIPKGQESKLDMTIGHLLTMTSGIVADTEEKWAQVDGPGVKDSALGAFLIPQAYAPGTKYTYDSAAPSILLGIVARATKRDVMKYAREKLFKPLGMTSVTWDTAPDGLPYGGFGLSMTPRDMLRFGYLYLNQGRWENKQIIPADWVAVTPPKSKSIKAYGYLFWNFPLLPFGDSYEANGAYGQLIEILPAWDMVIVRTGGQSSFEDKLDALGLKFW